MSTTVDAETLAAPLVALLASFGTGRSDAGEILSRTSAAVDRVHAASRGEVNRLYDAWRGRAGDAAMDYALRVQATAATVSDRGTAMAGAVARATALVDSGRREMAEILRSFRADAAAIGAGGDIPAVTEKLIETAVDHIGRAIRVVERVSSELDSEATALAGLTEPVPTPAPPMPIDTAGGTATAAAALELGEWGGPDGTTLRDTPAPPTAPACPGDATAPLFAPTRRMPIAHRRGQRPSRTSSSGVSTAPASLGIRRADLSRLFPAEHEPAADFPAAGVPVTLPDGSTVQAPNQQAAAAVRAALGQVGTPYAWGGTTPGVGLDCSGLTQWAYAQAGVSLPRLAQEQGYGHTRIGPGDVLPGDLAVWDGHVAMVIGDGRLVEAGDPVRIGPIRTENMDMRFLGFYRPTS